MKRRVVRLNGLGASGPVWCLLIPRRLSFRARREIFVAMTPLAENRARWLTQLKSTEPADRARAEDGARRMAAAAGFKEPQHFLWFDSPHAASWAIAVVVAR